MKLKKSISEFKPSLVEDYILFQRKERDGYVSIKNISESHKTEIVNSSYYDILTMCDGNTSIEDIITSIMSKYKGAPRYLVEKDVIKTIENLTINRGIEPQGNPFVSEGKVNITANIELSTFSTNDFSFMKKFLEDRVQNDLYIYRNPFYGDLAVNGLIYNRDFHLNKMSLILAIRNISENSLCGFMIWTIRNDQTVELQYYVRDQSVSIIENKILKNSIALISKTLRKSSITYKIFSLNDVFEDEQFVSGLTKLRFQYVNELRKEVNNRTVNEYQLNFGGI
ncbi:PqqD family protein [Enterococcus sp.]|uniref:PqqD family protein n=1 Tax=Enterococcus sp. TaxID=35783 RepID=UPI002914C9A8|nr:PqqD family protein [Enterococcus sp.]MDU5337334.1 PqqD family protein [Enterococcus sp.]